MATTKVLLNLNWGNGKKSEKSSTKLSLSESVLRQAKEELREDKSTREQALEQMRSWLQKNQDLENVRADDSFLLRFLRNKKFSVPMAQQQLLKYLNMRRVMPHLSANLDFLSPGILKLIDNGYIVVSPIRDHLGRRSILYFANGLNGINITYEDQVRCHIMTMEMLMESQEDQIVGVVHIGDFSGASTSHVSLWKNPVEFLRLFKWGEQSFPLRHKEIHIYNVQTLLKYVIDAAKAIVSSKIKERVNVHITSDDMIKRISSVDVLPKEMGGKIPLAEMILNFKQELSTHREALIGLDNMRLLSESGIIGRRNADKNNNSLSNGNQQVIGSFRKLEID